jgi:Flp pilus assembly protein TadG
MRGSDDEQGMVVVWFAIVLVLLLGCAAFAVDVTNWQLTKTREQRAADAAALAGAVTYPADPAASDSAAQTVAANNGYNIGSLTPLASDGTCPLGPGQTLSVCAGAGDQPYQYRIKVAKRVDNMFGDILGNDRTVVTATATAEYLRPLTMGSPSNQFGNDPEGISSFPTTDLTKFPNLWANVAGGKSVKVNGDAFTAGTCGATDGCEFGASLDYSEDGYYYAVEFTGSGSAELQVFDPAFVNVGDHCNNANLATASALAAADIPGYTGSIPPSVRYRSVANVNDQTDQGRRFCTGDVIFGSGPSPDTTYTVIESDLPGNPRAGTPVCQRFFPGTDVPQGYLRLREALDNGYQEAGADALLSTYFRQWADLCSVSYVPGKYYFIQVDTDADSQGHNRFAMRGVSGGSEAPVTIAGNERMAMYANVGATLTQFYLARVPTAAAGHTLVLNFYDIGDASSVGKLTIVPPTEYSTSAFSNCKWTGNTSSGAVGFNLSSPEREWGPFTDISPCTITGVNQGGNTNWNGQWSTVRIELPDDYVCDDNEPEGCWVRINYEFAGGLQDTTSWTASLEGDPVRLVK